MKTTVKKSSPISSNRISVLLALLAVWLIWGSNYLAIRVALESFPPFWMSGVRFLLAGGMLYLFLRSQGVPAPSLTQWVSAALAGTIILVGGNGGLAYAEQSVASGLAALGMATIPIWAAVFSGIWRNWPTRLEWAGMSFGLLGVGLLNLEGSLRANPLGAVALMIAAISLAFGSVWSRHLPLPPGLMASAVEMLVAGGLFLLSSLILKEHMPGLPTKLSFAGLIFQVVFASLVAYSAYCYLLHQARPSLATSFAYVNPIIAVGLGVGLAGEHITTVGFLAMLIILAGVALVALGQRKT